VSLLHIYSHGMNTIRQHAGFERLLVCGVFVACVCLYACVCV